MKKNYSDITVVLDRSGSMQSCKDDVIGGFNTFLEDQKKADGEATISLYQFDDKYDVVYEGKDLFEAPILNQRNFVPRGMTALFDAVGKTIITVGERYDRMKEEEKPEKIFFVIITDGQENDSREYTFEQVKNLIERQRDTCNWQFVFIGSEVRSVEQAEKMGLKKSNVMHYVHNKAGYDNMYDSLSRNIKKMRSSMVRESNMKDMDFFEKEDLERQDEAKTGKKHARRTKH